MVFSINWLWLLVVPAVVVWLGIGVYVTRKWDRGGLAMIGHDVPWLGLSGLVFALVLWPLGRYSQLLTVGLARLAEWGDRYVMRRWPFSWYRIIKANHARLADLKRPKRSAVVSKHTTDNDISSMYPYVAIEPSVEERFDRIQTEPNNERRSYP